MSHHHQAHGHTLTHEVPLFASSWVALFMLLRDSLGRNDTGRSAMTGVSAKRNNRAN